MSTENALQVAKALPLLSELHLELKNKFSVDEAIHFVNTLKQLKTFHFELEDQFEFDNFCVKLGNEWNVSIEVKYFGKFTVLERSIN